MADLTDPRLRLVLASLREAVPVGWRIDDPEERFGGWAIDLHPPAGSGIVPDGVWGPDIEAALRELARVTRRLLADDQPD